MSPDQALSVFLSSALQQNLFITDDNCIVAEDWKYLCIPSLPCFGPAKSPPLLKPDSKLPLMLPLGRDVMLGMDSTGMFTKLSTVSYFSFAGALLTVLVE